MEDMQVSNCYEATGSNITNQYWTYRGFLSNPVKYLPVQLVCVIKAGLLKNNRKLNPMTK